jgi:hypothetical protein
MAVTYLGNNATTKHQNRRTFLTFLKWLRDECRSTEVLRAASDNAAFHERPGVLAHVASSRRRRLRHIQNELADLRDPAWASILGQTSETGRVATETAEVGAKLWTVADVGRANSGAPSRPSSSLNDRRSQLKREINLTLYGVAARKSQIRTASESDH